MPARPKHHAWRPGFVPPTLTILGAINLAIGDNAYAACCFAVALLALLMKPADEAR
jgi:hypothetical protein